MPSAGSGGRSAGPPAEKWPCPKCTLVNEPMHLQCVVCREERPQSPPGGSGAGLRLPDPVATALAEKQAGDRGEIEDDELRERDRMVQLCRRGPPRRLEVLQVRGVGSAEHISGEYRLRPDAGEWVRSCGCMALCPIRGSSACDSEPYWEFQTIPAGDPAAARVPAGVRSRDRYANPFIVHPWLGSGGLAVAVTVRRNVSPPRERPTPAAVAAAAVVVITGCESAGSGAIEAVLGRLSSGRFRIGASANEHLGRFLRDRSRRPAPPGLPDSVLGQGAYGMVVRGKDSEVDKDVHVAIKVVNLARCASGKMTAQGVEARQKMRERELLLPRSLPTHSNIVSMVDGEEMGDIIIMVYELMAGGDLKQYIRAGRYLDSPAVGAGKHPVFEQFVGDLIKGTQALHRKSIAHRDLKPQNLLLSSTDLKVAVLKLADFGFAREAGPGDLMCTQVGTPSYIAPEVIRGGAPYTTKADVYSIGVVIVEMATGMPPITAADVQRLYDKKLRHELAPHVMNGIKQPGCADFCRTLLDLDPERRPELAVVDGNPFVQVCFQAQRERDSPRPRPPQKRHARVELGPCVSIPIAPRGQECGDALCLAVDSRGRAVIGTTQGFDVVEDCKRVAAAPLGDAAAPPSSADRYRRLGGGVQAVVALGVSLSAGSAPALSFAIAGGGRPAALLPGEVGLWDEDAGQLVATDTCQWAGCPESPHPVVSLAADGHWLAAATAEAVYVWVLDGVPARPQRMHRIPSAPNPTGVLHLSQRAAPEGSDPTKAIVCWPSVAGKGVVGVAAVIHDPQAPPSQGADGLGPPAVRNFRCGQAEELSALVCHMKSGTVAAATQQAFAVYLWNLETGAEVTVLSRGTIPAAIASLSVVDRPGTGAALLAVSARGTAHVWTRPHNGSWREGRHLSQKHQLRDDVLAAAFVKPSHDVPVGSECFWVLGPETRALQKHYVVISGMDDSMRLVQRLQLPPAPWVGPHGAAPSLADRPREDTIVAINLDGTDVSPPHMIINPTGRLKEAPWPCGVVLRGSEMLFLGSHLYLMPHMWLKRAVLLTRGGARPGVVQLEYRVGRLCATVVLEFPQQSTAASLFDRVVASTGCVPQDNSGRGALAPVPAVQQLLAPSPCRPLWLFLLWQQSLDRDGGAHTRWLPDADPRCAPGGHLGPRSLRHQVHAFLAGPRPVPPPAVQAPTGSGWLPTWPPKGWLPTWPPKG
eukprot:TRINITY_DN5670_c0_g2_i1.p1 TRINITY_DN5670_c0_g2~~TRINITY_DN5670_c0_g2_i1.p1  ORF type:complete len:1207 (+),score=223.09 TRINITY_DN5670_c0_g2_i1:97-3717(+)